MVVVRQEEIKKMMRYRFNRVTSRMGDICGHVEAFDPQELMRKLLFEVHSHDIAESCYCLGDRVIERYDESKKKWVTAPGDHAYFLQATVATYELALTAIFKDFEHRMLNAEGVEV